MTRKHKNSVIKTKTPQLKIEEVIKLEIKSLFEKEIINQIYIYVINPMPADNLNLKFRLKREEILKKCKYYMKLTYQSKIVEIFGNIKKLIKLFKKSNESLFEITEVIKELHIMYSHYINVIIDKHPDLRNRVNSHKIDAKNYYIDSDDILNYVSNIYNESNDIIDSDNDIDIDENSDDENYSDDSDNDSDNSEKKKPLIDLFSTENVNTDTYQLLIQSFENHINKQLENIRISKNKIDEVKKLNKIMEAFEYTQKNLS
jgi:hypothetical protein